MSRERRVETECRRRVTTITVVRRKMSKLRRMVGVWPSVLRPASSGRRIRIRSSYGILAESVEARRYWRQREKSVVIRGKLGEI